MLRGFDHAPGVDMVQGYLRDFFQPSPPAGAQDEASGAMPARCSVHCGTWLARRELFQRLGSVNERLRTDEDLDFHIRLRASATPRLVIPNVVLQYRWHDRSLMHGAQSVDQTSQLQLLSSGRRRRARDAARQSRIAASVAGRTSPAITAALVVKDGAR